MRNTVIAIASLAAGCSFSGNSAKSDGNTSHDGSGSGSGIVDAATDAPPDGPTMDFGPAPFTVHLSALPSGPVTLPATIDTDSSNLCSSTATWISSTQVAACIVVGTSIASGGGATVATGNKPLVLVSTSTISLTKNLDVASHRAGNTHGAGAAICGFTATPVADGNGGAGGAGGTFMTQGGPGGNGNSDNQVTGGTAPSPQTAPSILHGGCAGQMGANANAGAPGNGGGAVYLIATTSITITSGVLVNASGAGGTHGGHVSGGSGGGSGGMILLYSPSISANGVGLAANGGGASSGGDSNNNGQDGSDTTMLNTPAAGGIGPGGDGGHGGVLTTGGSGGNGGLNNQGGGGGGGGVGYIRSNVTLTGAFTSPAPDVVP